MSNIFSRLIIEYCEKCGTRIDADCLMDPLNAAKYCLKCGRGNHALVPFDLQQKPISAQDKKSSSSARLKSPSGTRLKAASSALVNSGDASAAASSEPPESFNKHVGNMAFYFCEKCGRRLSETDLAQGLAKNKQLKGFYCAACSVGVNTMELDAISIDELSAAQRKSFYPKPETKLEVGLNKATHSPRAEQPHKPAYAHKKRIGLPLPILLFVLALAAFFAVMNLPWNFQTPKMVVSGHKDEKKNIGQAENPPMPVRPPGNINDNNPLVPPGKREPPTPDPNTQAERERQVMEEMQRLRKNQKEENDKRVAELANHWTPAGIPTAAWYDASDASTIIHSKGAVSQWKDKSANNRHVSGGTSKPVTGTRTLNGFNVLDFDNNDYLENSANITSQPYSYAVIAGVDTSGEDNTLFDGNGSQRSFLRRTATNKLSIYANSARPAVDGPSKGNFLVSGAFNGPSSQVRLNGGMAVIGNAGTDALSGGIVIGNTNTASTAYDHDGTIGEIIIISGNLLDSDRLKVEGYLAHKWGLAANLPADHPYKDQPPPLE